VNKRITLFLRLSRSAGMRPRAMPSLEKSPRLKRTFAQKRITNIAVSTGWRAPRCGTAWTAMDGRSHTTASRHSSTRVRSLGVRWKVEGKVASEIPVASQKDGLPTAGKGCSVRA
jgi:hypothetical protein